MYRNWFGWVTTNLGRDARLAEIAASAATDAALHGRGFNSAAEAARTAWADGAKRSSSDQRSMPMAQPGANRARPLFYTLIAAVIGILVYPIVFGVAMAHLMLFAPLVVTLVAGFALGLLSRSWRIAIVCSWFIVLVGVVGTLPALVPLYGGIELDLPLALLVGGPGGAAVGGFLGARLRRAN